MSDRTLTFKEQITALVAKCRTRLWLPVLGVCGLLLVIVSATFGGEEETAPMTEFDTSAYVALLEERIENMVSSIDGAGKADVMITLEHGVEYVYADEQRTNSDRVEQEGNVETRDDSQRTVVTVDAGNGKTGLLVTEIQPTVRGVVVTCIGARDETVAAMVTQAVKTALNISDKRVCVVPYSEEKES